MDIEKLIEQLKNLEACAYGYHINGEVLGMDCSDFEQIMVDAADEISKVSTLQAENEQLRAEMSQARESLDFARTKDAEILRLGMELGHLKKHMERLTHRLGNGELTCNMARDDCRKMGGDCQIDSKILDRLAAYEETGLEPEEIDRILDAYGRGMTLRTENAQRLEIVKDIKTTRLRELAQADKEGRCVVLPCKVGRKVKVDVRTWGNIWNYKTVDHGKFLIGEIVAIVKTKKQTLLKIRVEHNVSWKRPTKRYPASAIGKTVLLDRQEAALRREKE